MNVNWVLEEDVFDLETQLAFGFLDFLLLGMSGSPLRKALIDSGLGEASHTHTHTHTHTT